MRQLTHFHAFYRWSWLVCCSLLSWSLQMPDFQSLAPYLVKLRFLPSPKKSCPSFHFGNQGLKPLHHTPNHLLLRNHRLHSVTRTTALNFMKWSKTRQATLCDVILSRIAGSPPLLLVRFWFGPDLYCIARTRGGLNLSPSQPLFS